MVGILRFSDKSIVWRSAVEQFRITEQIGWRLSFCPSLIIHAVFFFFQSSPGWSVVKSVFSSSTLLRSTRRRPCQMQRGVSHSSGAVGGLMTLKQAVAQNIYFFFSPKACAFFSNDRRPRRTLSRDEDRRCVFAGRKTKYKYTKGTRRMEEFVSSKREW